ncbi:MAG: Replication initiator protein A (RepA) N-terminus [Namikivirus usui]|uniref:Replication initiator protein A (RepA) N-terminus n=1 Tax=Bacteriophage sp. TaxID=38018 RepID=A0ABY5TUQ2_9VIRU|nr:MAG: Replication initiator protein A (RepA) N-terminus [Bacteriophage sp.]
MNVTINDNNFIAIQGWMRTKLNLKGYELIVYALIYGFSQDGNSKFSGTRRYIAEWCGCSMRTVDNTLASLLSKQLIVKHEKYVNGVRSCDYTAAQADTQTNAETPTEPNATEPQPLLEEPQAPAQSKEPDPTEEVVDHLNQRAGTHYKATTANTRKLIKARLKEGFTVDELKLVIDKKCADWLNNPAMVEYLRPETLFGPKFEGYLNAQSRPQASRTGYQPQPIQDTAVTILPDGHVAECTQENGWF